VTNYYLLLPVQSVGSDIVYSLNVHLHLKFLQEVDAELIFMPLLRESLQRLHS